MCRSSTDSNRHYINLKTSQVEFSIIANKVPQIARKIKQHNQFYIDPSIILIILTIFRKGEAIRVCIEKSLLKCPDPTPSNVVNSLLLSMLNATPCKGLSARHTAASPAATAFTAFKGHYSLLLVSFIMIFATSISTDLSFRTFNSQQILLIYVHFDIAHWSIHPQY